MLAPARADVRIQNGSEKDNGNFVLDAASMGHMLNDVEAPTYRFTKITTEEDVNKVMETLHKSDDLRGIMVLTAGDRQAYGATGHVDLLYEDVGWDLSMYGMGGDDLRTYLLNHLEINFKLEVWVLDED